MPGLIPGKRWTYSFPGEEATEHNIEVIRSQPDPGAAPKPIELVIRLKVLILGARCLLAKLAVMLFLKHELDCWPQGTVMRANESCGPTKVALTRIGWEE